MQSHRDTERHGGDGVAADGHRHIPSTETRVEWVFAHIPLSRIFGAFEAGISEMSGIRCDSDLSSLCLPPTGPSSLFDACMRVVVPFAVVDAALQARLPTMTDKPCAIEDTGDDDGLSCWWVSSHRWVHRITRQAAMRIAVWHWATLISKRDSTLPDDHPWRVRYDGGLYLDSWARAMGRFVNAHKCADDMTVYLNVPTGNTFMVRRESAVAICNIMPVHGERVCHPWGNHLYVYKHEGSIVAWVQDDPHFAAFC